MFRLLPGICDIVPLQRKRVGKMPALRNGGRAEARPYRRVREQGGRRRRGVKMADYRNESLESSSRCPCHSFCLGWNLRLKCGKPKRESS
jgi:hypothetical protein